MDRKKKGKSKGGKLGAIDETIEVKKSKETDEEKFSSPLYQEYMTKLMTNRGCQDDVKSRRFSVKEKIDDIESKSGETSKNGSPANIRASLKQAPEVKKSEKVEKSENVESGSEKAASKENQTGNVEKTSELKTSEENKPAVGVVPGDVEKTREVKTNEESSKLPNSSGEKTEESTKVTANQISANDKKEENPKYNADKSRSDLTNNVKKVVESGGSKKKLRSIRCS